MPSSSSALSVVSALTVTVLPVVGLGIGACDPYDEFKDESISLGAVDPANFPPANLGAGGNRMRPGQGTFEEQAAWLAGQRVGYFRYAMPANVQVMGGLPVAAASLPAAYVFDASEAQPVPDKNPCSPPPGWRPEPRL